MILSLFEPLETSISICFQRTSYDPAFIGSFYFDNPELANVTSEGLTSMQFVACEYGSFWWMVRIQSIAEEYTDIEVKFLHPHGLVNVFHWPEHKDILFVPITTFCVQLMLLIL